MEFRLRPWQLDDVAELARRANDPEIARNLRNVFPHPYSEAHGRQFIERQLGKNPCEVFAIIGPGGPIGGIGLHPCTDIYSKNLEMGYWLSREFWGRGITTRAARFMIGYGFHHFDVVRIFATTVDHNKGSQRVLEKAGLQFEGRLRNRIFKLGKVYDEMIYGIVKSDWQEGSDTPEYNVYPIHFP